MIADSNGPPTATESATALLPRDPGLTAVNEAWDRLPAGVRASIVMQVEAARGNS